MAEPPLPQHTYHEYLERLAASEIRLEFVDGVVYAMAGGTPEHNRLVMRLTLQVGGQLRPPCEAYGPDQKLRVQGAGYFSDLTVVCGEPQRAADDKNAFVNPTSVFEVLSPSTARTDETTKAERYMALPSLKEYVLVSQPERLVRVYHRGDGEWRCTEYRGSDEVSLQCGAMLRLAELYGS